MIAPLAHLQRHASEQPGSLAIVTPTYSLTFRQLADAVAAAAAALLTRGVRPGQLVALDLPAGAEWVVDLALLHLGLASVSLRGVSDKRAIRFDHLVGEASGFNAPGTAGPHPLPPGGSFDGPDAIFRYLLTSGTTGAPRAAAYSLRAFEYRMADGAAHWTDGRPELTLIGLSTTGGFHAAAASLELGVPYLAVDAIDAASLRLAARHGIRVLCGSPTQVARALQVMQAESIELPELEEIRLAGALPSTLLLDFIASTVGVEVRNVYGSTEGGGVSQIRLTAETDREDVGTVLPDVELQIVDPSGRPVEPGVEGSIRYRTPGQVSGYLVDGIVEPFEDGWFMPGDRGRLTPEGHLVLAGRESELLNLGGVKVDPQRIDDIAAGFPGLIDSAAFAIERRPGIPEAALAVVSTPECDLRGLDRLLRTQMPTGHPTAFWRIDGIPRSRLGKPFRGQLTEAYDRVVLKRV